MRVELTNTDFADLRSADEHPIHGGSANTIIFATLFHFYAVAAVLTYKFNSSLAPTLGLEPKSTVLETAMLPLHQVDKWRGVKDLNLCTGVIQ